MRNGFEIAAFPHGAVGPKAMELATQLRVVKLAYLFHVIFFYSMVPKQLVLFKKQQFRFLFSIDHPFLLQRISSAKILAVGHAVF